MIVAYPLLLLIALAVVLIRDCNGGRGWLWFGAWSVAGTLMTFSFLTGLSIGLLILPLATTALFAAALLAPHLGESIGFIAGAGVTAVAVAAVNFGEAQPGIPAGLWLVAGLSLVGAAAAAYEGASRQSK